MAELPSGTVTFVFTDIEGSTRLFQRVGRDYEALLDEHRRLLRSAFEQHGGHEVATEGDSFFVAFDRASDAMGACLAGQRALAEHSWPEDAAIRVRMGIHSGEATPIDGDYVALAVHQAARVAGIAHGGQVLVTESTRQLAASSLPSGADMTDLGTHGLKDLAEPIHLFQLSHADLPPDFPPLRSLDTRLHNLPAQLTSFVGREAELDEVRTLLGTTRLLTLTGPAGCGKTRLALQVATGMVDSSPDGVWLIDLATVADPDLTAQSVASALQLRLTPESTPEQLLVDHLRDKALLLVLDNCEHLADACTDLAAKLLASCADVRILSTSQVDLGVQGEISWPLAPLSLPAQDSGSAEDAARSDAVELFIDRARTADPNLTLSGEDMALVEQIVRRLDGIPLAIELAAARTRALDMPEIASRLDDRFRLLTGGSRTAPERQQTLRAALDWSHDLLSEPERVLFRRLAVFSGSFSLDAAEEICEGNEAPRDEIVELLSQLFARSLVARERADGRARYRLIESIRQYALEKLTESGELADRRSRHLDRFLALAERASPHLTGPEQASWTERLALEDDNLRAALDWSTTDATVDEEGLRLAGALSLFWFFRGRYREGVSWFDRALPAGERVSSAARGRALWGAGFLATLVGETDRARPLLDGSLAMCRDAGDDSGVARSLDFLGLLDFFEDDLARARELLEESAELARRVGDGWCLADALGTLGSIYPLQGQLRMALRVSGEGLDISRRAHDQQGIRMCLFGLALASRYSGDLEQAGTEAEEGLEISREIGDVWFVSYFLWILAGVANDQGRYEAARAQAEESLKLARDIEGPLLITCASEVLGGAMRGLGDGEAARAHLEEAAEVARPGGVPAAYFAAVLRGLGELTVDRGDEEAARTSFQEALDLARGVGDEVTVAQSLCALAASARRSGDLDRAGALVREALTLQTDMGAKLGIAGSLEELAALRAERADHETAALLLGCTAGLREEIGAPMPPWHVAERDRLMQLIAAAVGADVRDRAMTKAQPMGPEDFSRLWDPASGPGGTPHPSR